MEHAYLDAPPAAGRSADRRDADSLDARRRPGAAGPARGEPVLPACRAATSGRRILGHASRRGRGPDDRDGRPSCAQFQGLGAGPADPEPAGSRAHFRPRRRRHLPRRVEPRPDVLGAPDAGLWRLSRAAARACICAARARIPAAASPVRRATTPRAKSSPISGAAVSNRRSTECVKLRASATRRSAPCRRCRRSGSRPPAGRRARRRARGRPRTPGSRWVRPRSSSARRGSACNR